MNVVINLHESMISIEETGHIAKVDENPVGKYAFFCNAYNNSCNIVDGKAYEVPNLETDTYKIYKFFFKHGSSSGTCFSIFSALIHFAFPMTALILNITSRDMYSSDTDFMK
jgi:hypothetical protein